MNGRDARSDGIDHAIAQATLLALFGAVGRGERTLSATQGLELEQALAGSSGARVRPLRPEDLPKHLRFVRVDAWHGFYELACEEIRAVAHPDDWERFRRTWTTVMGQWDPLPSGQDAGPVDAVSGVFEDLASGRVVPTLKQAMEAARVIGRAGAQAPGSPLERARRAMSEDAAVSCAAADLSVPVRYLVGARIEDRLIQGGWDPRDVPPRATALMVDLGYRRAMGRRRSFPPSDVGSEGNRVRFGLPPGPDVPIRLSEAIAYLEVAIPHRRERWWVDGQPYANEDVAREQAGRLGSEVILGDEAAPGDMEEMLRAFKEAAESTVDGGMNVFVP